MARSRSVLFTHTQKYREQVCFEAIQEPRRKNNRNEDFVLIFQRTALVRSTSVFALSAFKLPSSTWTRTLCEIGVRRCTEFMNSAWRDVDSFAIVLFWLRGWIGVFELQAIIDTSKNVPFRLSKRDIFFLLFGNCESFWHLFRHKRLFRALVWVELTQIWRRVRIRIRLGRIEPM